MSSLASGRLSFDIEADQLLRTLQWHRMATACTCPLHGTGGGHRKSISLSFEAGIRRRRLLGTVHWTGRCIEPRGVQRSSVGLRVRVPRGPRPPAATADVVGFTSDGLPRCFGCRCGSSLVSLLLLAFPPKRHHAMLCF